MSNQCRDFEPLFRAHFHNALFDFGETHALKLNQKIFRCKGKLNYVRAAGFLEAASMIVVSTLFGTCEKVNGSME